MGDIEHSHWVMVCSLCLRPLSAAYLGHADDCESERQGYELAQVEYVPSATHRGAVEALREIAQRGGLDRTRSGRPLEGMDCARIARAALADIPSGVGEGAGSERASSRAGDYRRPPARREERTG